MIAREAITAQAQALGFDLCGIAPATALPELTRLEEWLARGYAGEMMYMHKSAETRADIRHFLPTARSVIVTATNYYVDRADSAVSPAHIARYAWGDDYHIVLAERLEKLVAWLRDQTDEPFDARIFVDKHHVQERAFARQAGLGWIGKNTMLINREIGSWTFLAGVALSLPLEADEAAPRADAAPDDGCGACTICIDACPTGALVDEYALDATRCISYLTIEHKGAIPEERRRQVGGHVYGCDICQEVCPYNHAPLATLDPAWQPKGGRDTATPATMWRSRDAELHQMLQGSAMTRVTVSRLRRNVAVVLGNTASGNVQETLEAAGGGVRRAAPSAGTDLVQEHVRWAREVGETNTLAPAERRERSA